MLHSARAQNYKSIVDSTNVGIGENITTIVGGNEAGKTNFLQSLTLLGDSTDVSPEQLCDYQSASLSDQSLSNILVSEAEFSLNSLTSEPGGIRLTDKRYVRDDNGEVVVIEDQTDGEKSFTVKRFADGAHQISFNEPDTTKRYVSSVVRSRINVLVNRTDLSQISSEMRDRARRLRTMAQRQKSGEFDDALYEVKTYVRENDEVIISHYEAEPDSDVQSAEQIINEIDKTGEAFMSESGIPMFESDFNQLPDIHYFGEIAELPDEVSLAELEEEPDEYPAYSSMLEYAQLEPDKIGELSVGEIRDRRQSAGEKFSELFNSYWEQSDIEIEIEISGSRVSLQFYDESNVRKAASDRSRGLRRFVSFLSQVVTQSDSQLENSIILLDSPGVHLHPEGHKNLRDSLESLASNNQILIATHAPYMISSDNLSGVRVARRANDGTGTKITNLARTDSVSDDSLAPVRAALGATFSDSLFSSSKTILVEGIEDRLYLQSFSTVGEISTSGTALDPDVQIIDCGGATKTSYMSRLIDAEGYDYAILLDSDEEGRRAKNQLIDSGISKIDVTMVGDILNTGEDATIEDLVSEDDFVRVASEIHDVEEERLESAAEGKDGCRVERYNSALKKVKSSDDGGMIINKSKIAEKISKQVVAEGAENMGDATMSNFWNLIEALNHQLDASQSAEPAIISID